MLANMDNWAKPYELAPGVVIKMLPFKPIYWQAQYEAFASYINAEKISSAGQHEIFICICPLATSICVEPEAELSIAMRVFIDWFNGRTTNIIENWKSFEMMVDTELVVKLWEAWNGTRDDLPKAPMALQRPAPLPVDARGNEAKPTKTGGKR